MNGNAKIVNNSAKNVNSSAKIVNRSSKSANSSAKNENSCVNSSCSFWITIYPYEFLLLEGLTKVVNFDGACRRQLIRKESKIKRNKKYKHLNY